MLKKYYLGGLFWAPIPRKQYQNTSGFAGADELGFKSNIIFYDFLEYARKNSSQTGRKDHMLNDQIALKAYEFWKDNSTVSVDRRNKRNMIKILKSKIHPLCKSIVDPNVSIIETKFGQKFQSHKYIYMKSLHTMHSNFIKTNPSISISTLCR